MRQTYTARLAPTLPGVKAANLNTACVSLSDLEGRAKILHRTELSLGAVAAALAQVFTIPVSVIATRQQLDTKASSRSFIQTAQDILSDDGITGLWRGLKPSLVLVVNPSITYGAFERFKVLFLGENGKMTPYKAFLIGALSKTIATIVRAAGRSLPMLLTLVHRSPSPTSSPSCGCKRDTATTTREKNRSRLSANVIRSVIRAPSTVSSRSTVRKVWRVGIRCALRPVFTRYKPDHPRTGHASADRQGRVGASSAVWAEGCVRAMDDSVLAALIEGERWKEVWTEVI